MQRLSTAGDGHRYIDVTEHAEDTITTDAQGWAEFRCDGGSVSVWVPQS